MLNWNTRSNEIHPNEIDCKEMKELIHLPKISRLIIFTLLITYSSPKSIAIHGKTEMIHTIYSPIDIYNFLYIIFLYCNI